MAEFKEKLFSEFPPTTTEEWMEKITTDLKGVPFEKKLVWKTNEGFNVNPFYRAEDIEGLSVTDSLPGEFPYVRGTKIDNTWKVRQDIDVDELADANAIALDVLQKGVTSLGFNVKKSWINKDDIAALLEGINPEEIELNFTTCINKALDFTQMLFTYFKEKGYDLNRCFGSINYDLFKKQLIRGRSFDGLDVAIALLKESECVPHYRVLSVNAHYFCDAGSFITQELGYALAWGVELIAKLTDKGISVNEIANRIKFNFGVSTNYFMEIAKFRAARWLWSQIVAAFDDSEEVKSQGARIAMHAHTSKWNMTIFDAYVNMLRTQTSAMSAAIGGVDSLTVEPFNTVFEKETAFSRRIARNQQLLLKEECHFDKVVDPGAGSYYIEVLTQSIANEAWKLFLSVEEEGGFALAVNAGSVQKAVNGAADKRRQKIATRRETLLGTNQFPNFTEVAGDKITKEMEEHHCCSDDCNQTIEALNFNRGAVEFEMLRLSTEASQKTPKVFMLTIGNLAMRLARAQFSANFFGCAGYKTIDNLGFKSVEEGVDAALAADADIVVLCSSDAEYAEYAIPAFKYLNGRAEFVVAGNPECTDDLKAAGIEYFVHVRSNVLETLQMFNQKLGIKG